MTVFFQHLSANVSYLQPGSLNHLGVKFVYSSV
jgi:hypothetical protein